MQECLLYKEKQGKGEGLLNLKIKQFIPLETYRMDHKDSMPSKNKNYNYNFTAVNASTTFVRQYHENHEKKRQHL